MRKYICRSAGCRELLDAPGYCQRHAPCVAKEKPAFVNAVRSNSELYRTGRWRAQKRKKLCDTPYCAVCGIRGLDGARLEVHHVVPPRGNEEIFFDESNLIVVCATCHKKITAGEIANRKS